MPPDPPLGSAQPKPPFSSRGPVRHRNGSDAPGPRARPPAQAGTIAIEESAPRFSSRGPVISETDVSGVSEQQIRLSPLVVALEAPGFGVADGFEPESPHASPHEVDETGP